MLCGMGKKKKRARGCQLPCLHLHGVEKNREHLKEMRCKCACLLFCASPPAHSFLTPLTFLCPLALTCCSLYPDVHGHSLRDLLPRSLLPRCFIKETFPHSPIRLCRLPTPSLLCFPCTHLLLILQICFMHCPLFPNMCKLHRSKNVGLFAPVVSQAHGRMPGTKALCGC